MTTLATKIQKLSEVKGFSPTQLCKLVPMSKSTFSQIKNGNNKNPRLKILKGLCNALDVSLDYLADDSIEESRSWQKVAADESLRIFFQKNHFSDQERDGLRHISFRESAPLTVKEWERTLDRIKAYSHMQNLDKKKRLKLPKDINSNIADIDFPSFRNVR